MKIVLVDIDGTLLDTTKLGKQIEEQFVKRFPKGSTQDLWSLYQAKKSENRTDAVRLTIEAGEKRFGEDFSRVFFEVDFLSCLDADGWIALKNSTTQNNTALHIFSEGSIEYQNHKVSQLRLGLPPEQIHIYHDKIAALPNLLAEIDSENSHQIAFVDDKQDLLDQAKQICPKIECYLISEINQGLTGLSKMLE